MCEVAYSEGAREDTEGGVGRLSSRRKGGRECKNWGRGLRKTAE